MRNKYEWLLAAAVGLGMLTACSKEKEKDTPPEPAEKVAFSMSTSISNTNPKGIVTLSSRDGGATNVDSTKYDLRYILEARTKTGTVAHRAVQIVTGKFLEKNVTFNLSLPAANYDFVVWADFVSEGATATNAPDLYYKTDGGLTAIEMLNSQAYEISNDARDAYYGHTEVNLTNATTAGAAPKSLTLKRPFGKYRIVDTNDYSAEDVKKVKTVKLKYSKASFYAGFNALTDDVNKDKTLTLNSEYTADVKQEDAAVGTSTPNHNNATVLAFDYLFIPKGESASETWTVDIDLQGFANGETAASITSTIPNVPMNINTLTTIAGNFLDSNQKVSFDVSVSDDFENEKPVQGGN